MSETQKETLFNLAETLRWQISTLRQEFARTGDFQTYIIANRKLKELKRLFDSGPKLKR